jgi:hypothetical protein
MFKVGVGVGVKVGKNFKNFKKIQILPKKYPKILSESNQKLFNSLDYLCLDAIKI